MTQMQDSSIEEALSTPESPPPFDTGAKPGSLKQRAVRGSAWTMVGFGMAQVLRLGGNLVVTRLLFPEAFGLMALVNICMQGLQMFSDVGIGPAMIQNKRGDDPSFYNTAWTMQVGRGFALWLVALALSYPVAWLYGEPMLAKLLPVASLTAIIAGFNSTAMVRCRRHLRLGRLTALQLFAQGVGIAVMVIWALFSPTVWSLVAAGLLSSLVIAVLSHFILDDDRNRFHWDRECSGELIRFGRWIFLSSVVGFLSLQYDRLWLGAHVSMGILGVYGVAVMMAQMPIALNMKLVRNVAYAAISRIHRDQPHRVREIYDRSRRAMDMLFLPVLGLMATCGHLVISGLYDVRYVEAGWMFELLALRAAMRCMLEPVESCLVAMGFPRYALFQHILRFVWVGAGMPLAWHFFGFTGVVWVVALSELPIFPVYWLGLARRGVFSLRLEGRAILLTLAGAAGGVLITRLVGAI